VSVAVDVQNLNVRFGTFDAVRDVSLRVDFGVIGAFLGPNGAGKTTTVETLLGFRAPTGGRVLLDGLDPHTDHAAVVARTGALLQRGGVWAPLTPREVLTLTATYYPDPRSSDELLALLDLGSVARTPWRRLSGGQQQRVLLALALLGNPRILVLDEPTAGVDPEGRLVIRDLLRAERDRGTAILLTTHDLADVEAIADHVTIVARGAVRAAGSLETLTAGHGTVIELAHDLDPVVLAGAIGAAIEVLAPRRWRVLDDEGARRLPAAVAAAGGDIVTLRRRATLEERYLELVQEVTP
jgi:ABC-2 type transport system ATP-binding protein